MATIYKVFGGLKIYNFEYNLKKTVPFEDSIRAFISQ